jgi:hypothetical protein
MGYIAEHFSHLKIMGLCTVYVHVSGRRLGTPVIRTYPSKNSGDNTGADLAVDKMDVIYVHTIQWHHATCEKSLFLRNGNRQH